VRRKVTVADIPFEMDYDTWEIYYSLVTNAALALSRGDAVRLQALTDQLRALPGYPMHAHPTEDKIVPVPKRSLLTVLPTKRLVA
jgi:hypothetical protein